MKRSALFLVAASLLVFALAGFFLWRAHAGVVWETFQPRLRDVLRHDGYSIVTVASCDPRQVPLPLLVGWQHRPPADSRAAFSNSAEFYTVIPNGSGALDCFVRYVGGRACFMEVRGSVAQDPTAQALRASLSRQFPGLPISVALQ